MEKGLWLAIGAVRKPHGVKGKISVTPLADLPGAFSSLEEVLVGETPHRAIPYRVIRVQFMKKAVLLQLEGLHLEEAARLAGSLVWARREQLPPLEEGEYYYQDLVGMAVLSPKGEKLGLVEGVIQTGDSHVLVCKKRDGRELLIPFLHGVVKELDQEKGTMLVDLPEGLE
jgi:16S rRNA processing protein RimM